MNKEHRLAAIRQPPPEEVLKAAITLEAYFKEQGVQNWKLGGCASRKYCEELEETLVSANAAFNKRIELVIKKLPHLPMERMAIPHINSLKTQERAILNKLSEAEKIKAEKLLARLG